MLKVKTAYLQKYSFYILVNTSGTELIVSFLEYDTTESFATAIYFQIIDFRSKCFI